MKFPVAPVLATFVIASAPFSFAEEETAAQGEEVLTVVGTRTERSINQVDATISVIDSEQIERRLMRDISDLVRYEPGVSVGGSGSRFGLEGFTIRGVGGNRVQTVVDGIRSPEEFSFGPFLSARRDFVDIDSISRAEIARGPISTLYGSDALGGVVAFTTRSPFDYVSGDRRVSGDLKAGYSGADQSWVGTGTVAGGDDRAAGLLSYTYRDGQEAENQGDVGGTGEDREKPDPQDITTSNLQLKGSLAFAEAHELTFGFVDYSNESDTRVLSDHDTVSRGTLVNTRDAEDERKRQRYSLHYGYSADAGAIHHAQAMVYYQTSETTQDTFETRTTPGNFEPNQGRYRNSLFEQDLTGIFGQIGRDFEGAYGKHAVTFGGEYYQTESSSIRDGGTFDLASGADVPEFSPLPTRDFPNTEVKNTALFLQDEMMFLDGRLIITPGVRWDSYDARVESDSIYESGNPGIAEPVDYEDSDVTWKLGGVWAITDGVSVYARYSEGFRAPPYDDVNVGFTNFIGGYKTISNPDLVSETSEGIEGGVRFTGNWGGLQFALFQTDYDNFIEPLAIAPEFLPSGIDPEDGLITFQSVNRNGVEIEGWELRGVLYLDAFSDALRGWEIEGAAAYAKGEDEEGVPIDSIDPLNTVLGLRWTPEGGRISTELIWTWTDQKDESDINDSTRLATDSWNVLDLVAHYRVNQNWMVDVGVFNLTDETYIRWADTVAIGTDAPARFTQPGINFSATLRASF